LGANWQVSHWFALVPAVTLEARDNLLLQLLAVAQYISFTSSRSGSFAFIYAETADLPRCSCR